MASVKKSKKGLHWCKKILRFTFGNVLGLLVLTLIYCSIGSAVFIALEGPSQQKDADDKLLLWKQFRFNTTLGTVESLKAFAQNTTVTPADMMAILNDFQTEFTIATQSNVSYPGAVTMSDTPTYTWTFSSGFLFCITTLMLIGYGNIVPRTEVGRMTLMIYGVIGIVLALLFLTSIGKVFAAGLTTVYQRVACYWCTLKRNKRAALYPERMDLYEDLDPNTVAIFPPGQKAIVHQKRKKANMGSGTKHSDQDMVKEVLDAVPMAFVFFVFWAYIVLGGLIFWAQEDWPYPTALYFSFVTLMTIGFGDYVPGMQHIGTPTGNWQMTVAYFYVLIGIALITMCVNLITEAMQVKAREKLAKMKPISLRMPGKKAVHNKEA